MIGMFVEPLVDLFLEVCREGLHPVASFLVQIHDFSLTIKLDL